VARGAVEAAQTEDGAVRHEVVEEGLGLEEDLCPRCPRRDGRPLVEVADEVAVDTRRGDEDRARRRPGPEYRLEPPSDGIDVGPSVARRVASIRGQGDDEQ